MSDADRRKSLLNLRAKTRLQVRWPAQRRDAHHMRLHQTQTLPENARTRCAGAVLRRTPGAIGEQQDQERPMTTPANPNVTESREAHKASPASVGSACRRFKVTCAKPLAEHRNPFLVKDIFGQPPTKILCRTWEFDAKDETEVRRLFKEAQDGGEPQVQGFSIRTIEDITPNS